MLFVIELIEININRRCRRRRPRRRRFIIYLVTYQCMFNIQNIVIIIIITELKKWIEACQKQTNNKQYMRALELHIDKNSITLYTSIINKIQYIIKITRININCSFYRQTRRKKRNDKKKLGKANRTEDTLSTTDACHLKHIKSEIANFVCFTHMLIRIFGEQIFCAP